MELAPLRIMSAELDERSVMSLNVRALNSGLSPTVDILRN